MWKLRRHLVVLLLIGLDVTVAILLCSCDDGERHRMLTFFFDGVPPLPGQESGPELPSVTAADAGGASASGWHVHKPISDCTQCHGARQRRSSTGRVQLVADVPQLCYKCHQEYTHLEGWVHGPVAVGECLLCHEPHKSRTEFLLVKPAPELCYSCHESQAIAAIEGHAQESYARCNDCHDGHASDRKSLLKPAVLSGPAAQAMLPDVRPEGGASPAEVPAAPATVPHTTGSGADPSRMTPTDRYNRSVQAYHAGRFAEAREGFQEVLQSRAAPQSMRDMAEDYLEKIEWLQREPRLPGQTPAQ